MRIAGLALIALTLSSAARADGNAPRPTSPGRESDADREQAALGFVRENLPELAQVLESLKPMRPDDYRRAVREIDTVRKTLANLKERDPKRYEVGLERWKARSRVELLTAKLVGGPSPELESQLREAVAHQLDVEIRQQKLEREWSEAQVKRLSANIERLEANSEKIIENRFQGLLKQSQRARKPDARKAAPRRQGEVTKKGESKG